MRLLILLLSFAILVFYIKKVGVYGGVYYGSMNEEWIKSAKNGDSQSQLGLALSFEYGDGFAEQNYNEAMHWYKLSARQGDEIAQENLSELYLKNRDKEYRHKKQNLICALFWREISDSKNKLQHIESQLSNKEIKTVNSIIKLKKEIRTIKDIDEQIVMPCITLDANRLKKEFINCSIAKRSDQKKCIWIPKKM